MQEFEASQSETIPAALAYFDLPHAFCLVMVSLGVVWRGDGTRGTGQFSSTAAAGRVPEYPEACPVGRGVRLEPRTVLRAEFLHNTGHLT